MQYISYIGIAFFVVIIIFLIKNSTRKRRIKLADNPYESFRHKVFNLLPESIGINLDDNNKIYCSIMEIGFPEAVATLVTYIDGNASLYFSSGGGIIGGFAHENVRSAAIAFVNKSQEFILKTEKLQSYPLPQVGHVRFYLLNKSAIFSSDIEENKLQNYENEFTELYAYGQNVITELRKIAE